MKIKESEELAAEIKKLKEKRNAIILAHVYQPAEVQEIADIVGDSLDLSRKAAAAEADVILFCGVLFMAETAAILSPQKKVILPDMNAGCGLADMAVIGQLIKHKEQNPGAAIVSYINTTALVKSVSDICCTSANAVMIVNSLPHKEILFLPDRNLGSYVAENTDKKIILWDGYCYVHENIKAGMLELLKKEHPAAKTIVHPESPVPVRRVADFTGGTSQMSRFVKEAAGKEFIVGTEENFVYRLRKDNPDKLFYSAGTQCEGMNMTTLKKVKSALEKMEHVITVPEETRVKAKNALDKMLGIS